MNPTGTINRVMIIHFQAIVQNDCNSVENNTHPHNNLLKSLNSAFRAICFVKRHSVMQVGYQ
uniref:Uncharacterized protein n=1 Tax=Parascaris equorum TaxID=6256 RepID=A0A914RRR2_PAREQ